MDHSKDTTAILMEAFDVNRTGVMLWDLVLPPKSGPPASMGN